MKRLYYGVARAEGFKKQGEYFVKEI